MKLTFRSPDGSLMVEAEPKNFKDAFEASGQISELLMPGPCGKCNSKATYPQAKHTKDYVFYEHKCRDCGATFSFGQTKEGGRLFPKTTDKDGNRLPNGGWSVYGEKGNQAQNGSGHSQEPSREPQDYSQDSDVPF